MLSTNRATEFQKKLFLSEEDKENNFWLQDDNHYPDNKTPLFLSYMLPGFSYGFNKAMIEKGKSPIEKIDLKSYKGYVYQSMIPYQGDLNERLKEQEDHARPLFPYLNERMHRIINESLMPYYSQLEADSKKSLSLQECLEKVDGLYHFYKKAWEVHFDVLYPTTALNNRLEKLYGQLKNTEETVQVYELLVGVMNKSLETERELWKFAEKAKQKSALLDIFKHSPIDELEDNLSKTDDGQTFLSSLKDLMTEYGYRKENTHEFIGHTWLEDLRDPLSAIQAYIRDDYDFEKDFKQKVQKREENYQAFLASVPDGRTKEEFIQVYQWALDAASMRDDHHFYIDAMLTAKSRLFLLNVGTTLVKHHVIDNPEDILFLYLDELKALCQHPEDAASLINQRKAEYQENRKAKVPKSFGTPPKALTSSKFFQQMFGSVEEQKSNKENAIKGFAASKGQYTGRVKVIHSQDEFDKLQKGDILVCKTTTPSWTVLFSVAGAVVTDAGGILSHSGIIAREYKIPAVVGTKAATAALKDGDLVTVDGSEGVVTIENQE
ncbi:pyruvate,water dikinase [Scopulibacillus daqui]|uniref:Pyruvate,water dikinase n=1 Tax=Scopulibacillus daqui TaxID=1469162 RepID=A0ABS2Q0T6_9BACL|nr:PEP-utilizing enzyme [Scopulibacillus daqui]MBM7645913.1 pyruvate,water dikinase [Scopulibacillus daqui]